jgi:hypothetical protein
MSVRYSAVRTKIGKKITANPVLATKVLKAINENKWELFYGGSIKVEGVKIKYLK